MTPPRTIVHLDADAFFAAVEQASDAKLRGKPVAVGGEKRGIIASASYEARKFGVFTPMPTARARKLCPKLIVLSGDFERYEQFSNWMFGYCYDFTPDVEQTSIDEGYFDLSCVRKSPVEIALTIRKAIGQRLKIMVSEGIGTNKLVSAVASKLNKPAAFNEVPPGGETDFLHPLPNKWLPGIGPKTSARLNAAGLAKICHIAGTPLEMLELLLGNQARGIRQFAHGIDERPLVPLREPQKSFSQQETFATDVTDEEYIQATVRRMADNLFAKVREENRSIRTLTVRVRYNDMAEDQVNESLLEPTDLETDVYGRLHTMLTTAWRRRVSLRLVSLKLANVYDGRFRSELALETSAQRQDAQSRLAVVIDELRRSRGHSIILRGHDFRLRTPPTDTAATLAKKDSLPNRRGVVPAKREVSDYVPLRVHSHYSFLDSTLSPTAIVESAKRHGLSAVALTDTGNLHGAVEFVQAAKQHGVKPILGTELRVGDKPLLLYVESVRGYHNHGNYAKAVEFYRQSAAVSEDTAALFNMGLVFNHPEVSQDADAADAYRRALGLNPKYEKAQERLETTKKKLLSLANRARSEASNLIQPEEFFQFYINPFEVFPIEFTGELSELDAKTIQRAKKRLLSEIELNDGKVEWLENQEVDRARALALEDELYDEEKRRFHWSVFENKHLLRFLTRGEIEHFLYSDEYFPDATLQLLDEEPNFRAFVSKPFARQYNLLLSRSIERRALATVEAMFDGRRWVDSEDEDICFEGATKRIGDLVGVMRAMAAEGDTRKITVREAEDFLREHSFPELFNLLPTAFASFQMEVVAEMRSLAISCYNSHGDPDLSKGVLNLCKKFTSRSVELTQKLDEDFKIIERKIAEERKAEVRLQFGQERPFEITKEGIKDGTKFFPAKTIKGLRWGIMITGYTGAERYEYVIVVTNDFGATATASWTTSKADEEKQTEFFSKMVNACMNYLAETVVAKIHRGLNAGDTVLIGSCGLSRQGVSFQTQGILFKKDRFVSWSDLATEIRNGQMVVSSKSQHGVTTNVSMKDTDNAVLLPFLRTVMETQNA